MDFVHDTTAAGHAFRALTLVDTYTRECHVIEVARSLPSARVIRVLGRMMMMYGRPERIRVDNGPEFASRALDQWATRQSIQLRFITPGKRMENGHIESFNGKLRDECLNQHWFRDLADAQQLIEAWRIDYNTVRPHSAMGTYRRHGLRSSVGRPLIPHYDWIAVRGQITTPTTSNPDGTGYPLVFPPV